ncbi:MAG: glutamine-synthetase adenylyltransferase, partial [Alphaproteobacteria bacterium]|nr:glutamine-synthetase adenylyltransferase [Alphaproteobacteria bacterium]
MKTPLSEEANVTTEALMKALRLAKSQAHLAIAVSDLDQSDPLLVTTGKITDFADMAVNAALSGTLASTGLQADGLFFAALGKMGAGELNYSSDIDMAAFFDSDLFDCGDRDKVETASRIVRDAMRVLDQQTGDGYVFRTDLRLRPDPSSTPLAVSMRRAELYYESVGQNWERMVWIKGRPAGGDLKTGAAFLKMIEPFVWRRHLDYWAIADVHAIKHMINAKDGDKSLADIAADVKLSAGGIREIEFFVQTQQIILGGRNPDLRVRGTLDGLERLVALGAVDATTADDLADAYRQLRAIEHRIQMLNDQQTHKLPSSEDVRADVAALCGQSSLDAFDQAVLDIRRCVNHHY